MLQDGVSKDDVQFYMEIDCRQMDNSYVVSGLKFEKPTIIHPILFTDHMWPAVQNLMNNYKESFNRNGHCRHPFIVFCSHVTFTEYIVGTLRNDVNDLPNVDPLRVKGIWSAIQAMDDFCKNFSSNPNEYAHEADVIVCTSVIGAGFSISTHFQNFHALLFNNILPHNEARQFIQHLRYVLDNLPENAQRQSYLFVEKGCGTKMEYTRVLQDFRNVREFILSSS